MKKVFLLLALASSGAFAQTTVTSPSASGFTNMLAPFLTNSAGTNVGDLAPLLVNLQGSLSAVLPALVGFNNSFTIVQNGSGATGTNLNVGSGTATATNATGTVTAPTGTAGSSAATGGNLSAPNTLINATVLGQNPPSRTAVTPSSPVLTTTSGANAGSASTTTGTTTVSSGATLTTIFGTNTFGFSSPQDALRGLIVLEADVERMLPLVAALNGTSPTAVTNVVVTNTVPSGTATSATTQPGTFNLNQTMLSFPTERGVNPPPGLTAP